jgi:hypothetical protein
MTKPFEYLLQGALKMCGCNDGAGKPVLLVSYNDNIVRLYDLPTYGCFTTITQNPSSKSKGILQECCSLFTDSREQSVLFIAVVFNFMLMIPYFLLPGFQKEGSSFQGRK